MQWASLEILKWFQISFGPISFSGPVWNDFLRAQMRSGTISVHTKYKYVAMQFDLNLCGYVPEQHCIDYIT